MNIVPTPVEQYVNRVNPKYRTWIGISWALFAAVSAVRVLWLILAAIMFASAGWSPVTLIFGVVLWSAIGVVAAIAAVAFLTHVAEPEQHDERSQP